MIDDHPGDEPDTLINKIENDQQTDFYMSLKPSNMISMQFLTMTVDLIMKFRVDPSSRNSFLIFLSKKY